MRIVEFIRGNEPIDWMKFKANLARLSMMDGWTDVDGIMWLGMAGDPDAWSLFKDLQQPAHVNLSKGGLLSKWTDTEHARYNLFSGRVEVNQNKYPTWDNSDQLQQSLAHEFRHRGFAIIRAIPKLFQQMPEEYKHGIKNDDNDYSLTSFEHMLVYSMDGFHPKVYKDRSEQEYWRSQYFRCSKPVNAWLKTRPLPKGAPEALQAELKRVFKDES